VQHGDAGEGAGAHAEGADDVAGGEDGLIFRARAAL
jgi:hypothetical protein